MGEDFSVRVDKWLWAVRIFKTRSDAADACRTNRVLINGAFVKPSREIKVGDTVTVKKMPVTYTYRVAAMVSSRQPAKNVPDYVENLTSQAELDKLCVVDRYPSDSIVFSSHGYDLHIDNELVAEAFSTLPQIQQSILILHCTLDLADGEIGNLVGMSRSAVQRHRTKALQELREALSALMPKGG